MVARAFRNNRLLAALTASDRALLERRLRVIELPRGKVLFEPGEDVVETHFPVTRAMTSLVLTMKDGTAAEAATIGREGAVGGIVSAGHKPAFARAVVQIPGLAVRIETARIEEAKQCSPALRDLLTRYADALLAQVLQSVACNALHAMDERLCRCLLTIHDRVNADELPLTQEYLAGMLGVHRATVVRVAQPLQKEGLIRFSRGRITILNRKGLERAACECHAAVARHFARVLPGYHAQKVR
ncbi:MAG TPA: Crp/Fnr family transcriptional regulator [Beijerinckiaceae bacterium]|jgi:CRP-like cAMP-binding protein